MRILLDECVPRPFRRELSGHEVRTIPEMHWEGKRNGVLLSLMSNEGFEVLITTDQNLRYQQNPAPFGIAIVVMMAASNRLVDLKPLAALVAASLGKIAVGEIVEISA